MNENNSVNNSFNYSYQRPHQTCECDLFVDLNTFRRNIEEGRCGLHHYPYTTNKGRIILYKSIFFGICGLFLCLSTYLHFSHLSWTFDFIFKEHMPIKELFSLICAFFSVVSFGLGIFLSPEGELALEAVAATKRQMKKIYSRRLCAISCVNNSSPRGTQHERAIINHTYEDVLEKVDALKRGALMTLKRISISKQLNDSQKEHLYNQAILELQFKLEQLKKAYLNNDFASIPDPS